MVLGSVGRGYCKKKMGLRIFGQNVWLGCLSAFKGHSPVHLQKLKLLHVSSSYIGNLPYLLDDYSCTFKILPNVRSTISVKKGNINL